ncbi:hypothetical protein D3C87_1152120 [compost metagenome]
MKFISVMALILLPLFSLAKPLPAGNLFTNEEPLKLTLKYDIGLLQKEKASYRENGLPGTMQLDGKNLDVSIMTRGKGSFSCRQTQLKIDFSKAATAATPFEGFGKIKLFTSGRCLDAETNPESDKIILSNYLIYKLYEQIFPLHFKTRLVEISYTDAGGKVAPYTQLAFFMEPEKSVEARLSLKRIENPDLLKLGTKITGMADEDSVNLMHAFQFFIGNYDYGVPGFYAHIAQSVIYMEKNVQMFQDASGKLFPIAYDWDFSRFIYVGGPYCNVGGRFFIDGTIPTDCSLDNLSFTYEDDLVAYRYKDDVIGQLNVLKYAFQQWRAANKENLEKLGPKYLEGLDAFDQTFEPAVRGN